MPSTASPPSVPTVRRLLPTLLSLLAVLSADYLKVPEEEIRGIESVLTVLGGEVVYAAAPFADLSPAPLPAVIPAWSPVAHYGGYARQAGSR